MDQHNRELIFGAGGRPYNNKDFEVLQQYSQFNKTIYKRFSRIDDITQLPLGYILEGCNTIGESGLVWLDGQVRYVTENLSLPAFPAWIIILDESEDRVYADESIQPAFTTYKAEWTDVVPTTLARDKYIAILDVTYLTIERFTFTVTINNVKSNEDSNLTLASRDGSVIIEPDTVFPGGNPNTINFRTALSGNIGGNGTANKITKFVNSTTLADSVMTESGGKIGINTGSPIHTLHVNGSTAITSSSNPILFVGKSDLSEWGAITYDVANKRTFIRSSKSNAPADMYFMLGASSTALTAARIDTAGQFTFYRDTKITNHLVYTNSSTTNRIYLSESESDAKSLDIYRARSLGTGANMKMAGLLVSSSYSYANPVDNQLIVRGTIGVAQTGVTSGYALDVNGKIKSARLDSSDKVTTVNGVYVDSSAARGIRNVTGGYGTVQTIGTPIGDWAGYNIDARWVFMGNSTYIGIYNDISHEWILRATNNAELLLYHNGNIKLTTTSTGITVTGDGTATDWIATSDERIKENIIPLNSQLDKVNEVGKLAVNYNLNTDESKTLKIGFVAQQLEKVYPEFVVTDSTEEKMKAVNYAKMVAPLYKAISELSDIIKQQQTQIDELKSIGKK